MRSSDSSPEAPPLIVIVGPTAVGKTGLSITLAERFNGEVINCDSRQVYRRFDIGTDKPGAEDRRRCPHHLIDIIDGKDQFTAADFAVKAALAIADITARGKLPLVAGGTGLYIKAFLDGLFPGPARDERVRTALEEEARREGLDSLFTKLQTLDPEYAAKIGPHDRIRIVRALEVQAVTGSPLSTHFRATAGFVPGYRTIRVGLRLDRQALCRRIDERVDGMFERGLADEVQALLRSGLDGTEPPFKALGYKHVLRVLRGELTAAEAAALTKIDTRRYAKRQMTWFRKMAGFHWFDAGSPEAVAAFIHKQLG